MQPESWVRVELDALLPSPAGPATPGIVQDHTLQVEPAFFIDRFECRVECDADAANPIVMRSSVKVADFAAALSVTDITEAARAVSRSAAPSTGGEFGVVDESERLTLEDAGYDSQPPNRRYAVTASADLRSADGQVLGYRWIGIVDNWNARAFTSFVPAG